MPLDFQNSQNEKKEPLFTGEQWMKMALAACAFGIIFMFMFLINTNEERIARLEEKVLNPYQEGSEIGSQTGSGDLSSQIKTALEDNPQILTEVLEDLFQQQDSGEPLQGVAYLSTEIPLLMNGPTQKVIQENEQTLVLVEFYDYRCPYCRQASKMVSEFLKRDLNIAFILRDIPILGPESEELAAISVAASILDIDQFFPFHDALMKERVSPTAEEAYALAAQFGYARSSLEAKSRSLEVLNILKENLRLAQQIQLNSTPGFALFHKQTGTFKAFIGAYTSDEIANFAREVRQKLNT